MSIGAGMTSAIMNPLHSEVKTAIMAADVLNGQDENCAAWIAANRDPGEAGEGPWWPRWSPSSRCRR